MPEDGLENINIISEAEKQLPQKIGPRQLDPQVMRSSVGTFSGAFGPGDVPKNLRANVNGIFTIRGQDLALAAATLLNAWKNAQSEIPCGIAEFKILAFKDADWIHGVVEIGGRAMSDKPKALKIVESTMLSIAAFLAQNGYQCRA